MDRRTYYSEINAYEVIVLLEITESHPDAWVADPTNSLNQKRGNEVSACVWEWLKGNPLLHKGSSLKFSVVQTWPISGRIADYYGPWSGIDLQSLPRVLVFTNRPAPQANLEQMFIHCGLVIQIPSPAYPYAVEDVRLAESLMQKPKFPQLLATPGFREMMTERRKTAGPLLARFMIDMVSREAHQVGPALFYEIIESSDAEGMFRAVLLTYLAEQMALIEDLPIDERVRLVRAMVRILREPPESAKVLQEGIEQADLCNIIFDASGRPYISADQVFPDKKERSSIITDIRRAEFPDDQRERLVEWLQAK